MSGLAKGIEKSKSMVTKAVDGLASDMVISPQVVTAGYTNNRNTFVSADGIAGITSAIAEAFGKMNGQTSDIVIPIYLGGTMLDEVVVNAQQRTNLRSGGR